MCGRGPVWDGAEVEFMNMLLMQSCVRIDGCEW